MVSAEGGLPNIGQFAGGLASADQGIARNAKIVKKSKLKS